jgi:uncharacterized membrane protein (UPF0127 family)
MRITHRESGTVLAERALTATTFWRRLTGYMFLKSPDQPFDGIYFPGANWLHNSFVRFPLDVIFTNDEGTVVAVLRGFKPWRFSPMFLKARNAIEFPAGRVPNSVKPGDRILLSGDSV